MKVIVNNQTSNSVTVNNRATSEVVSIGIQGPSGSTTYFINGAQDVDTTQLENGATLVWKSAQSEWVATRNLEEQNLEGGQY